MRTHPFFLGLSLLAACSDGPSDPNPGGSGELGVGSFTYLCRSEGDFTCAIGQTSANFPMGFAVGGRFGLSYAWKSESDHLNDPLPILQSAAPEHLKLADQTFTALVAGYSAVLAVTGNSDVVDLIHASIRTIDDLRLVDPVFLPGLAPLTELVVPKTVKFQVQLVPLDLNDVPLSGDIDVVWTLDADTVVQFVAGEDSGRVRLEALAVGDALLTATVGDKSVVLPITVDASLDPTTGATDDPSTTGTTTLTTGTADTTADTTGPATTGPDTTGTGTSSDTTEPGTSGTTTDTTGGAL
jgi:hypothetical protein